MILASWFDHFINNLTYYDLTSGWIPCAALLVGLYTFIRRHNCPTKGCWRIGRHQVPGTPYVTCRRHHPHPKPTADDILRDHEASRR